MDPLAEVLGSIRLSGGVFLDVECTEPWGLRSHLTAADCRLLVPEPAQIIAYHAVLEGRMLAWVGDQPPIELEAGHVVLIPRNEMHQLASAADVPLVDSHDVVDMTRQGMLRLDYGGGGRRTRFVCGFLASGHSFNPLIQLLPRLFKVDTRTAASRDWIEASIRFAAAGRSDASFASSNVMARLSELLLVEAIRQYSATLSGVEVGWFRGARDPQVGRALALMHEDLRADWSNEALAREVAMSRSAFVERFTRLVGLPPIRYLTVWRLQIAQRHLRETTRTVQQLAHAVGYASEEAFSRAFKREFGVSPAQWRQQE